MDYSVEEWTIEELLELYSNSELNLDPPYQRNDIWGPKAKKRLIDSIKNGYPLPAFFLHKKEDDSYDMVDGQQRTRAIIGYKKGFFKDNQQSLFDQQNDQELFKNYTLSITIIQNVEGEGVLEDFYYRVNKFGSKLNRPEIIKAQYFDTVFQDLVQRMAKEPNFEELDLFTSNSLNRMNDLDFVGELLSLLKLGITSKKKGPDKLYESDNLSEEEAEELEEKFKDILSHFNRFNEIKKISGTRYRQRNDFYTLFGFIENNKQLSNDTLDYFYKVLLAIEDDISPTNDECFSFQEYATNCVSQSNSKRARRERLEFLNKLLLNKKQNPLELNNQDRPQNEVVADVIEYYDLNIDDLVNVGEYYLVNEEVIRESKKENLLN